MAFLPIYLAKATKTGIAISMGFLSTFLIDFGLTSALVTMGTYLLLDRPKSMKNATTYIEKKQAEAEDILSYYPSNVTMNTY